MRKIKNVLLTFDYELFLGKKSGSVKKCLLRPTEKLRAVMRKNSAIGVFFIDTLCLLELKKHEDLKQDFEDIAQQLLNLSKEGHYIFPHIHPHWMDAKYLKTENQFNLSELNNYSLASLDTDLVKRLFNDSINLLKAIGVNTPNLGYRAGGWCMQPFRLYKEIFLEHDIKYEFSVLPGYKNDDEYQNFDYSNMKYSFPYAFSDRVDTFKKGGEFIEFPISTISFSPFVKLRDMALRKYLWKTGDRGYGDGIAAESTISNINLNGNEMVSVDILNTVKLNSYKKFIKNHSYMHWISHPKMTTKNGLKNFDLFLQNANANYNVEYDFKKMYHK